MARTTDQRAHAAKRHAILDCVERLIAAKGYEHLTINDVITDLGISKGALYHYFPSKPDLLSALIQRRLDRWEEILSPIANGPGEPTDRLRDMLRALGVAKSEDRAFFVDTLRSLYADENALVYLGARRGAAARFLPLVEQVVADGRREGHFPAAHGGTARVVLSLIQECADNVGLLLLKVTEGRATGEDVERTTDAYIRALHSTLGAPPGTLDPIDRSDLQDWTAAAATPGGVT